MRNVGQALGVALLGAVLLFGITGTVRERAADASISEKAQQQLAGVTIDLGSDRTFEDEIAKLDLTSSERGELVGIEADARLGAVRAAYVVGAVIVLAGLATTPSIALTRPSRRDRSKAA